MRFSKIAFIAVISGLVTLTVLAQQDKTVMPASQNQDQIEKAHADLLNATTDRPAEAGRLTDSVAAALPQTAMSNAPIPRRNYIDEQIFGRMERDKIPHAPLAGDEEFVRRVYVDVTGLLPTPDKVREFVASKDPAKRDKLIDSLVGTDEFAEQWAWLWSDLLQTHDAGFSYWLKRSLKLDRPYNDIAKEILGAGTIKTPTANPVWAVTAEPIHATSRNLVSTDPDNYFVLNRLDFLDAINVSFGRVFMGINMDCFSCHDGAGHLEPLNLYLSTKTRAEFARQAAFWGRLNMVPTGMTAGNALLNDLNPGYVTANDAPYHTAAESRFPRDGKTYEPAFILTGEKPKPGADPRKELGRLVTSHVQFNRATVNIVWGKLMTVGFVEPWDGFDLARLDPNNPPPKPWTLQPTNPWLLEAMANDFRDNNYSLHNLIKSILKSSAYQLSTQFPGEWKDAYAPYYARRYARVMTGAEVADTVAQVTGVPYEFSWAGQNISRVKQLATPIDVNAPNRVGGVNDLGGEGTVEGNSIRALMQSFFQSTRETPAPLANRPSAVQAMLMMTAPTVVDRVGEKTNGRLQQLLNSGKSDEQVIEEMFLSTLSRQPKAAESELAVRLLRDGDRKQRAGDIQWVLLNTVEFLLNH